jgi:hypothetical protein
MFVVVTVACAAAGVTPSVAVAAMMAAIHSLGKSRVPSALLTPSACAAPLRQQDIDPCRRGEEEVIGHIDTERRLL